MNASQGRLEMQDGERGKMIDNPLFLTMEWVRLGQVWGKMSVTIMLAMTEFWMDWTEPYS